MKRPVILVTVLAFAVFFAASIVAPALGLSANRSDAASSDTIAAEQHVGWSFTARQGADGNVLISVDYDTRSKEGIERYAQSMRTEGKALLAQGEEAIHVVVTFVRPISLLEFEQYVQQSGMKTERYQFRGYMSDGTRTTVGGAPSREELVPAAEFKRYLASYNPPPRRDGVKSESPAVASYGLISVEGEVGSAGYRLLADSPEVYVIDVGATVALRAVTGTLGQQPARYSLKVSSPFWFMEDYGIVSWPTMTRK